MEAAAKAEAPATSKEDQKGAPAQVAKSGPEVVTRNGEAKAGLPAHVDGHNDGKAPSPPPQADGYSQISKKAA